MDPSQDNLLEKKRAELEAKYTWIRDYVDKGEMTDQSTYILDKMPLPEHLRGKKSYNLSPRALCYYTTEFLKERNIIGSKVQAGCTEQDFWFSVTDATTRPTTPEPRGGCILQ